MPPTKKKVNKTTSGLKRRRKTLQVSDYEESEDETKDRPMKQETQEGRTLARKRAWKSNGRKP